RLSSRPADVAPGETPPGDNGAVTSPRPQPIRLDGADAPTFFDAIGGHETFEGLVSGFYARVAHDPVLAPIYEGREYAEAAQRLQLFLEQYWGGPRTYSEVRGHPRLRARHAEFHIHQRQARRPRRRRAPRVPGHPLRRATHR